MLRDEEGVLHVAGGVVGSKVHLGEHVQVVLHFGTVCQHEAHAREDVYNLVGDDGQRMACTQLNGVGSACQVYGLVASLLRGAFLAQLVDALCGQRLQLVDFHADGLLLVGGNGAEVVHQGRNLALLAQVFQAQLLDFLGILCA